MLIGFNNDVEYNGRMFHIQTEDNGIKNASLTTILFFSGQILESKRSDYKDILESVEDDEERKKAIKKRMVDQHRIFYKKLFEGTYEDRVAAMTGEKKAKKKSKTSTGGFDPDFKPSTLMDEVAGDGGGPVVKDPKKRKKKRAPTMPPKRTTTSGSFKSVSSAKMRKVRKSSIKTVRSLSEPDNTQLAFRGILWPRDELRLDGLVAEFLDTQ